MILKENPEAAAAMLAAARERHESHREEGIHVSDLLVCLRRSFFQAMSAPPPETLGSENLGLMMGEAFHSWLEPAPEIPIHMWGLVGTPDALVSTLRPSPSSASTVSPLEPFPSSLDTGSGSPTSRTEERALPGAEQSAGSSIPTDTTSSGSGPLLSALQSPSTFLPQSSIVQVFPLEIKSTKYSAKKGPMELTHYVDQVAAYAAMLLGDTIHPEGLYPAQIAILYIMGDYGQHRDPIFTVYDLTFHGSELLKWRDRLLHRADQLQTALDTSTPPPLEAHLSWACKYCPFHKVICPGGPGTWGSNFAEDAPEF